MGATIRRIEYYYATVADQTGEAYRLLAADLTAPEGLRNRATQMQEFLAGALAVADTSGAADTTPESGASTTGGDNQ